MRNTSTNMCFIFLDPYMNFRLFLVKFVDTNVTTTQFGKDRMKSNRTPT